ncbi:glucosaminidase domain-containing protein [Pontibacterium sp.]|uniref:glucosaminidase domain-containing protein n=1 Tax=Pontibacterium sp. TaxID=2036026 RepID=UPI003514CD04
MYLSVRATIATLVVLLLLTLSLTQLAPSNQDSAEEKAAKAAASQPALAITYKPIHTPDDIEALTPPLIKPVAYTRVSTLATLEVSTKKQKFFDMILPAVLISKQRLEEKRERLAEIEAMATPDTKSKAWLKAQLKRYKAQDIKQLKVKLADHPTSIILAQAALETGWGTSRFFLEGNNIFGVWSFNPKEPRMRASQTREGKPIYVKRYGSLIEAVDDYFVTIARGGPYREFRKARIQTNDPLKLIKHLNYYSEIGDEYVSRLRSLINRNKMVRFDNYQLQTAEAI